MLFFTALSSIQEANITSKEFVLAGKMPGWGGVAGHIVSFVWKQSEINRFAHPFLSRNP